MCIALAFWAGVGRGMGWMHYLVWMIRLRRAIAKHPIGKSKSQRMALLPPDDQTDVPFYVARPSSHSMTQISLPR